MYYFFVTLSAILFSLQFLCQQKYEEDYGVGLGKAIGFSLYKGIAVSLMMLILSGFKPGFSWFSFWISGVYALCYILMIYFSQKAFSVANLSIYSVFTMLGGMLLPFVVGVGFFGEELNSIKIICCILVVLAVLMNIRKGTGNKKAFLYYMLVFVLNGSIASISKIHESAGFSNVNPQSFMMLSGIWTIIICAVWLLAIGEKLPIYKGKNLLYSGGDGLLNGVGDMLLLISLSKLDASVQYPLVTGGVMVFSTVISVIRREKVRKVEYFAAAIALLASIMMAF